MKHDKSEHRADFPVRTTQHSVIKAYVKYPWKKMKQKKIGGKELICKWEKEKEKKTRCKERNAKKERLFFH